MIDGCPEGWAGTGIPVCVLAAGATQQETNSSRGSRDGMLMKERDYMCLGLAATPEQGPYLQNASVQAAQVKMECDDVELSLGLGLPEKATHQSSHGEQQLVRTGAQPDYGEPQAKLKLASAAGAKLQHFWHQSFRVNLSNNDHLQQSNLQAEASSSVNGLKSFTSNVAAWSSAAGRFAVPVPKVSTIPAKRPFVEAVGERRALPSSSNHVVSDEAALPCGAMPVSVGMYTWNVEPSAGSLSTGMAWQQAHVGIDQGISNHSMGGGSMSSAFAHSRQLPPPHFKVPQAGVATSSPPTLNPSLAPNGAASSVQAVAVAPKPEMETENNTSKAPVVGWPPVRSFRKNTLQAAQSNRMSSEDLQSKSTVVPPKGGMDGVEHMNGHNNKSAFFVKAKLDGVRICRKVDLKAYNSYDGLKVALQDMFQGFVSDNTKLDLLHGNNYVVTHEDKDGDCLLVGDVPWPMFVESSVKSLRIMKSMDAVSIGDKAAKLKVQANGNL